jgi:hypothetical protein
VKLQSPEGHLPIQQTVVTSKPKRAARRQTVQDKQDKAPTTPTPTTIVVRRGALKRFDSMKKKTAGMAVKLVWDRRVGGERRAELENVESNRRASDRRQQPPFTWSLADFVVVPPDGQAEPSTTPESVEKKAKKP